LASSMQPASSAKASLAGRPKARLAARLFAARMTHGERNSDAHRSIDRGPIIRYSLKYGKVKRRGRAGRARPGQPPRRLSLAGAGRTGRSAGGPSGRSAQARAEYVDVSL